MWEGLNDRVPKDQVVKASFIEKANRAGSARKLISSDNTGTKAGSNANYEDDEAINYTSPLSVVISF